MLLKITDVNQSKIVNPQDQPSNSQSTKNQSLIAPSDQNKVKPKKPKRSTTGENTDAPSKKEALIEKPLHLLHKWIIFYDEGSNAVSTPKVGSLSPIPKSPAGIATFTDYKQNLQTIGDFDSIQMFWAYWSNIDLSPKYVSKVEKNGVEKKSGRYFNLRIFIEGVTPAWEDKENANGGEFEISVEKVKILILMVFGNCFEILKKKTGNKN